ILSLSGGPITFSKDQGPIALNETWQPQFGLTYSGHRGMTKDCVHQVKSFFDSNPMKAQEIDNQMKESVNLCQKALLAKPNHPEALVQLKLGLDIGKKCFQDWGLVDQALENQMNLLLRQGALAVKPTGSGGGGYILSLWASAPPKDVISCFS
ncbi:MAG TPA: hypothetical protein PLJ21_12590, partial [Pseudobdellovibrionaceae bacterium]|nr:hypothetical protein [Pseudobdellovibrionaceae bacterium]